MGNPSALPSTNIEKQDQCYTRWSTECGHDMADFMIDTWGLEVTQTARDAVAALSLPAWMPVVATVTTSVVFPDTAQLLDLEGSAHSMDGVANLTVTTSPTHGVLVNHGDGLSNAVGATSIAIRFMTSASRRYVVEYRDDFSTGSWQDLQAVLVGTGAEVTIPDPTTAPRRCYRLRVSLP